MTDIVSSGGNYYMTEHYHKRVLAGSPESVRLSLVKVLEQLGYDILDDEPNVIRGRRGPRGWASAWASADVLEYPMTLIVKLKPNGPHATLVTFDYVVKHPSVSKGERAVLTREAEAISSMAMVRAIEKVCPACGTDATDDSRFCRRCGAPMTVQTSDLELLRMAAEVRAGYTSIVGSAIVQASASLLIGVSLLVMLLMGTAFPKGLSAVLLLGVLASFANILIIAFGWNRISRALKTKERETPAIQNYPAHELSPADEKFAVPAAASVTEATTNLLDIKRDPRATGSFPQE